MCKDKKKEKMGVRTKNGWSNIGDENGGCKETKKEKGGCKSIKMNKRCKNTMMEKSWIRTKRKQKRL